jgi:hypothetical protein
MSEAGTGAASTRAATCGATVPGFRGAPANGAADDRVVKGAPLIRATQTPRIAVESLRAGLLWLMGFAGGFVFIEPSPYEIMGLLAIFIFAATGLSFRASLLPLFLFLILLDLGYASALVQVIHNSRSVIWVCVSAFLAATAIFYAAMLGGNTQARLGWLLRGYVAAALVASLAAIAGYLHVSSAASELFLRYGRARGTFNDPNVLGAFLVPPALLLL